MGTPWSSPTSSLSSLGQESEYGFSEETRQKEQSMWRFRMLIIVELRVSNTMKLHNK